MKTAQVVLTVALAAAGMFSVADAMAQYGGGIPGGHARGGRMDKGGGPGSAGRPPMQEAATDIIEYRLSLLQEDLKLAPEQERAWASYEDRTKALASDIVRDRARSQSGMSMTALQQVDHAVDTARNRLAAWEDIAAATKALYDGLTPQQKALADERIPSIVSALTVGGAPGFSSRPGGPGDKGGPGRAPAGDAR